MPSAHVTSKRLDRKPEWPLAERPRERLLERGADALSDAELLAIVFATGTRQHSALGIARELLARHGGLRALFDTDCATFCALPGLGRARFAQLHAAFELYRRYLAERLTRLDAMQSPQATIAYLRSQLGHRRHEVFACLFLDNRHRVIAFEVLFHGTIDGASVHPRVVVERALAHNAAALILAHNHPSGIAEASEADRHITDRLSAALRLIDVRIVDHIIIGDTALSFAQSGLLSA